VSAASVSVTGNITGGNVLGGANVNATTHTGATVSVTGNITGGNVLGGANVNATIHTGTTVSVSGTVTGANLTVSSGFLTLATIGGTATSVPSGAVTGSMWYRSTNQSIQVLIGGVVYNVFASVA
jgi:hypothetical protein